MTPEEITTFDQARAAFEKHGLTVEKATEPKIWLVAGSQRLDKGGVIQEARALVARKAQQESQPRPAPDRRWSSYAQAGNNALVPLREIRTDGGTQSRTRLDSAKVAEYREALDAGAHFPPVVLFYDGSSYWICSYENPLGIFRLCSLYRCQHDLVAELLKPVHMVAFEPCRIEFLKIVSTQVGVWAFIA